MTDSLPQVEFDGGELGIGSAGLMVRKGSILAQFSIPQAAALIRHIADLREKVAAAEEAQRKLREDRNANWNKANRLGAKLAEANDRRDTAWKQALAVGKERDRLRTLVQEQQAKLDKFRMDRQTFPSSLDELREERDRLRRERDEAIAERNRLRDKIAGLEHQLRDTDHLREKVAELERERDDWRSSAKETAKQRVVAIEQATKLESERDGALTRAAKEARERYAVESRCADLEQAVRRLRVAANAVWGAIEVGTPLYQMIDEALRDTDHLPGLLPDHLVPEPATKEPAMSDDETEACPWCKREPDVSEDRTQARCSSVDCVVLYMGWVPLGRWNRRAKSEGERRYRAENCPDLPQCWQVLDGRNAIASFYGPNAEANAREWADMMEARDGE